MKDKETKKQGQDEHRGQYVVRGKSERAADGSVQFLSWRKESWVSKW